MRKRVISWTLFTLVVVSCATFGTARARQVEGANAAQHHLLLARSGAVSTLLKAERDGVRPDEMAPYRQELRALSRMAPPRAMPLWDPSAAGFYDRQSAAYRRLTRGIRSGEARATAGWKTLAASSLAALAREIETADSLDLDVSLARKSLAAESAAFSRGRTAGTFRTVLATTRAARYALDIRVRVQLGYVHAVIKKAGGIRTGVLTLADHETQTSRDSLALLGLLTPRSQIYQAELTRLNAAVHAQSSLFAAAVQEGRLQGEVRIIAADYARTVPTKLIVVSTENQHADLYDGAKIVYSTDVTTGGPELPTDHGIFHIYFKASPFVFHSPWAVGSPYYYNPTPVQFWMPFDGGEGLHDASWRSNFGVGSNLAPTDLGTGNTILGTHGCVNLPFAAAQFVWDWAPVGTTVVVV